MNPGNLSSLAQKLGAQAAPCFLRTQVRFRKNLWEPKARYINESKLKGWKRRDGDRTKDGFRIVNQFRVAILPGQNVEMKSDGCLYAIGHGRVMETVEKTNLNFDHFLVQMHYAYLKNDDSRFYRHYVHVIPEPQSTQYCLSDVAAIGLQENVVAWFVVPETVEVLRPACISSSPGLAMPGLVAFGRRWSLGSDDFVIPGVVELFIKCPWVIAVAGIFLYHRTHLYCPGGHLLLLYLIGVFAINVAGMIVDVALVSISSRGTIIDDRPRRNLPVFLYVRLFLCVPELAWVILGTYWCFSDAVQCNNEPVTVSVVSELMSGLFTNADLVPSDVAAGFVLLHAGHRSFKKNSLANAGTLAVPAYLNPVLNMKMYSHDLIVRDNQPESWMTVKLAAHYFKYAWGAYGWFYFLYLGFFKRMWMLRKTMKCFGCCRRPYYKEDNCCQCYVAALKLITGLEQDDILYLSMTNNLFETPFYVALDHESKSIVVTIRGTLSLHDVLTDLSASSEEVSVPGIPEGTRSHKGMFAAARSVANRLEDSQVLVDAKAMYPDYQIVLVGHSLGAAVAGLLACLLRPTFPDLRCYAYSGPGTLTPEAAKITEKFVMSVVLGHDIVPRLCLASAHALKIRLIEALEQCRYPKHRILMTGCCGMLFGGFEPDFLLQPRNGSESQVPDQPLLSAVPRSGADPSYESLAELRMRFKRQQTKESCDCLLIPGKILYIESRRFYSEPAQRSVTSAKKRKDEFVARWARPEEFNEILVTPKMIFQHLPANLHDAFTYLISDAEASSRSASNPTVAVC
ncbi:unnamed protein product [Notodromas monacha]|uniref:sn-1-specific diacylglycerol lipase n=1 Tax=Notodromas monacha TaxID=399045 RepID=A0A7R9GBY5_9CRUS|nr:unnamed protein product [Notodromas monacha]CAG0915281.1 unnamed protein product [Notodromas monacha]